MAKSSETIYTHTCDLCGEVKDQTELRQVWNGNPDLAHHPALADRIRAADICGSCQAKPVSEVFAFFTRTKTRAESAHEMAERARKNTA